MSQSNESELDPPAELMNYLVSRSEFARMAGVSAAAITKACGRQLQAACDGSRIDVRHEAAEKYLQSHGVAPASPAAMEAVRVPSRWEQRDSPEEAESSVEEYLHLTLQQLIERFGTVTRFKDWLAARKTIEDIREKRLKNENTEGGVISRELVQAHVIGLLDGFAIRLLGDAPRTLVRRLHGDARAGVPPEESEETARDIIASHLSAVTTRAKRALKNHARHAVASDPNRQHNDKARPSDP